jgi:hypothetical protein
MPKIQLASAKTALFSLLPTQDIVLAGCQDYARKGKLSRLCCFFIYKFFSTLFNKL